MPRGAERRLRDELSGRIAGEVHFDRINRAIYSTDASVYQIMPVGVVKPKTRDDVLTVMRVCRECSIPITARGGGTSQAGQAIGAGLQLDFSRYYNRILDIDPKGPTVRVEPGIVLDELNRELKSSSLELPLDLSTANQATIGGMIANNSAGTRSVLYGKTLDYVLELTVALSDGSIVRFAPLSEEEVNGKCEQDNLEGKIYRVVCRIGSEHANEIDHRFPKILRRVGGYNLDELVDSKNGCNLARLIVGSEGTLGIVLEAKLKIVPLPEKRIVCVIQFEKLLDSLAATPAILDHHPSAVELVDRGILDTTLGKPEFEPLRDFIVGDPGAVLIVEFLGKEGDDLPGKVESLANEYDGHHIHRAIDPSAQARIWKLRKAALGLSMAQVGDAKSISFVEDSAVAPERLHDYIEQFQKILKENDTEAGFYAHASVGLLHIRPVINMKTADGIGKFERILDQISDLLLEFGGALSGEHGDGLVRAPFQERMFGPVLYQAFREIKRTFDPSGLLNPGKIVDAPPLTENLRYGTEYRTNSMKTAFDFSDFGGISRAAEQCGGVGDCRKLQVGTMCPSYMATLDERDSTRGRANALRLAISGQLGPDGMADHDLHSVLDLCLECKACKTECPTGVDMARMKSEFLHQYHKRHGAPLRAHLVAHAEGNALWGSRTAPFSNWLLRNRMSRFINEKLFGFDRRRVPPAFSRKTFLHWWGKNGPEFESNGLQSENEVCLFVDTFTNYHEPEHAIAAARVIHRVGWKGRVLPRVCCGRPLISKGFLDSAKRQARRTVEILYPVAASGLPIIFCEPSCYSAVVDDHPNLLRGDWQSKAHKVAEHCLTFEQWIGRAIDDLPPEEKGQMAETFAALPPQEVLVHGHCHQKALIGIGSVMGALKGAPNLKAIDIDSGCCGMAGSFGYEKEHYDVSRACGERKLFPAIRNASPKDLIVAPGFSCRHQIEHFLNVRPLSMMQVWDRLLRRRDP